MANISVGEFSYCQAEVSQWNRGDSKVTIGNYTSVAMGCRIIAGGEHNTQWITTFPLDTKLGIHDHPGHPRQAEDIYIGNDVWIAYGATILPGSHISDGVVVGAMSVVAKYIPPYAIVVGNPCKIVRYRFTEEQIEALLRIQWWNWPRDLVVARRDEIQSDNIEEFIEKYDR